MTGRLEPAFSKLQREGLLLFNGLSHSSVEKQQDFERPPLTGDTLLVHLKYGYDKTKDKYQCFQTHIRNARGFRKT